MFGTGNGCCQRLAASCVFRRRNASPCIEMLMSNAASPWEGSQGIVKLFGNACGAVDMSGLGGERWWLSFVFQDAAAVMIWFQTAKRLVISVRHSGALIR